MLETSLSSQGSMTMDKKPARKKDTLLNDRQIRVLQLLIEGNNISQIADELSLSRRMVDVYIHQIKAALGATTREQAVAIAIKRKLITP